MQLSHFTLGVSPAYNKLSFSSMRIALNVAGIVCLLVGGVWILQGINILPGSFMTGQTKWAINGGLVALAGIGLLLTARRRGVR